ncbi:MAG: HNH endonuclease [Desulfobulbaceae bacterium]|nr:HNH endonuclease [Desulfobulbaceae bacterium]
MVNSNKPSYEYIQSILTYDLVSGELLWKFNPKRKKNWNTSWAGKVAGSINRPNKKKDYYRRVLNVSGQMIKAHHIVWLLRTGDWPTQEIDHIDRNPLNNRWWNLRLSDRSQQNLNTKLRSDNQSGTKGVCFDKKAGKWKAEIWRNRKNKFLGYGTLEECRELRLKAEKKDLT